MTAFVSVRLSQSGRAQAFLLPELGPEAEPAAAEASTPSIADRSFKPGDRVVVETGQGTALGQVAMLVPALAERRTPPEDSPRRVLRPATREDVALRLRHEHREREAFQVCAMKIREHALDMKLTRVEQLFDGSRLIFYYTAEERVDFRELVRELAAHFRTRIEMRQIGVRDEAKMLGGYGPCGRPL
jgi:cell fate regulator YaaT (PSP1 superfamily)